MSRCDDGAWEWAVERGGRRVGADEEREGEHRWIEGREVKMWLDENEMWKRRITHF